MEFFNKAKTVRFRSHLDKFLVADDDEQTVRQSRNGSSQRAHWTVEFVDGKSHVVRLKSCHGWYLTASDEPFLLGMTGKKVVQAAPTSNRDTSVEWEPIKEGELYVKLRSKEGGKFLRANGGTPPWRNSVTHDFPYRTATQDWVLWEIEVVDISDYDVFQRFDSTESNFSLGRRSNFSSSYTNSLIDSPQTYDKKGGRELTISDTQTLSTASHRSLNLPRRQSTGAAPANSDNRTLAIAPQLSLNASRRQNGMIFFNKAKVVRLQNHHGKYLVADDDESTVRQSRNGSSQRARWTVEYITGKDNKIRLKSCHGLYLTASNDSFLLGMTGKKVVQFLPPTKSDSSTEWEPIKEGFYLKLKTNDGNFLRANWGTPPWRNSVTHDIPQRTATQDWVLWEVEVVDILIGEELRSFPSFESNMSNFSSFNDGVVKSPKKDESRLGFSGRSRDLSSNDKVHFYNASTLF